MIEILVGAPGKPRSVTVTGSQVGAFAVHPTYKPQEPRWAWTVSHRGYALVACETEERTLEAVDVLRLAVADDADLTADGARTERQQCQAIVEALVATGRAKWVVGPRRAQRRGKR